jgi:hypothetical protein
MSKREHSDHRATSKCSHGSTGHGEIRCGLVGSEPLALRSGAQASRLHPLELRKCPHCWTRRTACGRVPIARKPILGLLLVVICIHIEKSLSPCLCFARCIQLLSHSTRGGGRGYGGLNEPFRLTELFRR